MTIFLDESPIEDFGSSLSIVIVLQRKLTKNLSGSEVASIMGTTFHLSRIEVLSHLLSMILYYLINSIKLTYNYIHL